MTETERLDSIVTLHRPPMGARRAAMSRLTLALLMTGFAIGVFADPALAQTATTPSVVPSRDAAEPSDVIAGTASGSDATALADGVAQRRAANDDMSRWLERKHRGHELVMAAEARLLYRRGLIAHQAGDWDQAVGFMRGAAELDPTFTGPQWTLASWYAFRDPGEALHQIAGLIEAARQSFVVQLDLIANTSFLFVHGFLIGWMVVGLFLVLLRGAEIRHAIQERLATHVSRGSAVFWSWVCFAAPFGIGAGLVLPTAAALAFLWPLSKTRERAVLVLLVVAFLASPLMLLGLQKLILPMHRSDSPFYGVHMMQNEAFSAERSAQLKDLSEQRPDNPFVQFGVGWMARQGSDPVGAEAAYRRVVTLMPGNDRVLNNLGNALALQGRHDEAITIYRQAIGHNPENAAAFYNMAQAHTQRFEFRESNEALSRASALDFDLVRVHQAEITEDGVMPRVDQWLAPATFWNALLAESSRGTQPLPPAWRGALEGPGNLFPIALMLVVIAGLAAGFLQKRVLPLRRCGNCDGVVCRRCAARRRQVALCNNCAQVEAGAASGEFARTLLRRQKQKVQNVTSIVRTGLGVLIPGFGLLVHRHVVGAFCLLATTATLVTIATGYGTPFNYEGSPRLHELEFSGVWTLATWVLLYVTSLLAYAQARMRSRLRQEAVARAPVERRRAANVLRDAA